MSTWSKVPSRWVQITGLRAFSASAPGENAAALKLYMSIAMFANFKPTPQLSVAGFARLSFSELEELCDISRQYVKRGIDVLVERGLVSVEKIGNAHGYLLENYDVDGWAKIPQSHLLQKATYSSQSRFASISIRGRLHLEALKLYLALLTFRPNQSATTMLSYDKIVEYTGMPRTRIRRSIDVLVNHEWISLESHTYTHTEKKPTNAYVLRGDFWGKGRKTYARASRFEPEVATVEDFAEIGLD